MLSLTRGGIVLEVSKILPILAGPGRSVSVQLCTVVYSCVQWPNTPSSVVTTICWPAATESESMKESQPYTAHCGLLPPLGRHVTTPTSGWWWWWPRPACVIM